MRLEITGTSEDLSKLLGWLRDKTFCEAPELARLEFTHVDRLFGGDRKILLEMELLEDAIAAHSPA